MESKYIKAILKLNRLTKENKIEWTSIRFDPDSISGEERLVGSAYITNANDKVLRLYKYEYKYYVDEDDFHWIADYRLEFIDKTSKGGWKFPSDRTLEQLYDTVLYKTSGADEFVNNFLADE